MPEHLRDVSSDVLTQPSGQAGVQTQSPASGPHASLWEGL